MHQVQVNLPVPVCFKSNLHGEIYPLTTSFEYARKLLKMTKQGNNQEKGLG